MVLLISYLKYIQKTIKLSEKSTTFLTIILAFYLPNVLLWFHQMVSLWILTVVLHVVPQCGINHFKVNNRPTQQQCKCGYLVATGNRKKPKPLCFDHPPSYDLFHMDSSSRVLFHHSHKYYYMLHSC